MEKASQADHNPFSLLVPRIRRLIEQRGFKDATAPQVHAFPAILQGKNLLLVAPTGTGKTEAALLPILSSLATSEDRSPGIRVLYITPLKALNRDLLDRLEWWCKSLDLKLSVRHGDTETSERNRQRLAPPQILITTPETLQAILPGWVMRQHLQTVRWVVVDEVHELAGEKRGSQLSIGLERLKRLVGDSGPQIIGLSATIGTPERVAKYLVGSNKTCTIEAIPVAKSMKLHVLFPAPEPDDNELASKLYTFPEVAARLRVIRRLLEEHKSTLLFTNTRSEAEILSNRFRIWDQRLPISVHHGSLSKPTRIAAERDLKDGRAKAIISTSSLELGIDVGRLDLVIQYNSPRQVTRLLQRVGRSGHGIGRVSEGVIITQDSDDALEAVVIARRALIGELEPIRIPDKPYDALAHQIVGLLLQKSRWSFEEALGLLNGAEPYHDLSITELSSVLRYMHDRFPRLAWVSFKDEFFSKPQNTKLYDYYFGNLSMIPDERHYLVLEEGPAETVGLLDEAFVAEHGEVGTKFVMGGRVWRIKQAFEDKIYVENERDPTGAIPSWIGEEIPVPFEIAQEVAKIRGDVELRLKRGDLEERIFSDLAGLYPIDTVTISRALGEVVESVRKGIPVPNDRRIIIESWGEYVILQCAFGHSVNRTLARIIGLLLSEDLGSAITVHQDPYRIVISGGQISSRKILDLLRELPMIDLESRIAEGMARTGMFKRRFLHVAKKFGAVARDAELGSSDMINLMEAFRGTAIYEESIRSMLFDDADMDGTKRVLEGINTGEITLDAIECNGLSPVARVGMEEISRKSDIIPPERMTKMILESVKARLLSEARTVVCTDCWDYVESRRLLSLQIELLCPQCGSNSLGISSKEEELVNQLVRRVRLTPSQVPNRFSRLKETLISSAELVARYGFSAALALAGRNLSPLEAEAILRQETAFNDRLVDLIMGAEKKKMRKRFYA